MPEGPSLVILRELVQSLHLEGQQIVSVGGNTKMEKGRMLNQKVKAFRTWGKHFLICFNDFSLRVHFMLFGTYRINERKENEERLRLVFEGAELNFYACSLKFIEGDPDLSYDWSADVLSDHWNPSAALKKIKEKENAWVCDLLLDQDIFAGVGNIIKNEVLYRVGIHPLSKAKSIPASRLKSMIGEARQYSFDFLKWKKEFTLRAHWLIHTKKNCPLGHRVEKQYLGKTNRRSFFCTTCQKLFNDS